VTHTPFHDLDDYIALPRLGGLALSPDGRRLVTGVSTLNEDRTKYVTALWEVDPAGERPARRLTQGHTGESQPTFTQDGDLLFVAKRGTEDDAKPGVWRLPAAGGEASLFAAHPGGVAGLSAAARAAVVTVVANTMPAAVGVDEDHRLRTERTEHKVSAILHAGYPVRYWDHDLGPDLPRLYAAEPASAEASEPREASSAADADASKPREASSAVDADAAPTGSHRLRDLTPAAGGGLTQTAQDLAADGTFLVTTWNVPEARGSMRSQLRRIDVAHGTQTVLLDDAETEVGGPQISPDGTIVAFLRSSRSTAGQAPNTWLEVVPAGGGEPRALTREWDRWPGQVRWLPDGSGLLVVADDDGRSRLFHVALDTGEVTRLTDEGALTDVVVAPDGSAAYALRASYAYPAEVVRIDLADLSGEAPVTVLRGPAERPALPGTLTEVETTTADGVRVRAWLALPEGASAQAPAPLLLWIHGGPLNSWNTWSWRWNPWLMVARGYAVLLPDPALSTGYGQDFVQRGWGAWGGAPFTDLMAITDAVEAREDIDAERTAAMGGSFGGYMANWVAGHTDRFRAIVTHASLWALDAFGPTTDAAWYWGREMTPEMALANSPHLHVGNIRTPMLVIHGDKDYRVPIGEGLRLWYELLSSSGLPADSDGRSPHRFLYYPDENHWILTPQNAKVWYQVNLAFLAEHVLGEEASELPTTLGAGA